MNCQNCGAPVKDGDLFCKSCGARIVEPPELEFVTPDLGKHGNRGQSKGAVPMTAPVYDRPPHAGEEQTGSREAKRTEKDARRQANSQVKEAKAAYKEARKAAGKSAAPKVIGVIIAIVVVAAAGAAAMWYFGGGSMAVSSGAMSQGSQESPESPSSEQALSSEPVSSEASSGSSSQASAFASASSASAGADGESANASDSSAGASPSSSDPSIIAKGYLGTWSGDMTSTSIRRSTKRCYGAREYPMELEIAEFESTGRVSANAKVLVHAHKALELDRDVDSCEGDGVVELKGLTGTYKGGSVEFKGDTTSGIVVKISLETDDSAGSARQLVVTVDANDVIDVYRLVKKD